MARPYPDPAWKSLNNKCAIFTYFVPKYSLLSCLSQQGCPNSKRKIIWLFVAVVLCYTIILVAQAQVVEQGETSDKSELESKLSLRSSSLLLQATCALLAQVELNNMLQHPNHATAKPCNIQDYQDYQLNAYK